MFLLRDAQGQLSKVLQFTLPLRAQRICQIACLDSGQPGQPAKAQPNNCVDALRQRDPEIHRFSPTDLMQTGYPI
ncbi:MULTISPECIES: hypothetical protein [Bradyrhizobium]|uniref:Uncharacterized protein n=1 Tax=Bradyrhizobium septentrionale TaxID=1404411 RepID=A0ABZ2P4E1_9BRAD